MTISRFHVVRMNCAAGEQLVRIHLADLDGVKRVVVDLDSRHVIVDHQRPTSDIAEALQQLELGTRHVDDNGDLGPTPDIEHERSALVLAFASNAAFFVGELAAGQPLSQFTRCAVAAADPMLQAVDPATPSSAVRLRHPQSARPSSPTGLVHPVEGTHIAHANVTGGRPLHPLRNGTDGLAKPSGIAGCLNVRG